MQLAPYAITGGVGLGASWLGSKLAGGLSPEQRQAYNLTNQAGQMGLGAAGPLLRQGQSAYGPVMDYWSRILSGNRGEMTSALAPEIEQIGQGYGAQTQALANLMPRGGGRATLLSQLPYQQM